LDKLVGLDLIDSSLQGSRPYTRQEAARQVLAARGRLPNGVQPPVAAELLRRLEGELREELTAREARNVETAASFTLTGGVAKEPSPNETLHISYTLTNTDDREGFFDLDASADNPVATLFKPEIYADGDSDGSPDDATPLTGSVALGPGESFVFVVALPPRERTSLYLSDRVTVSATSVAATGKFFRFKPLRELRLEYLYREGKESIFPGPAARQFALNANNFGIGYRDHHNVQAVFESEARLGRFFLVNLRPLATYRESGGVSLRLLGGKAALGLGPLELSAGRQSLWWGQGRHGSLVLTGNAKPLDMARLTNPSPAVLPWIFKYLGPIRFDLFVSRLEDDRVVPEPYFGGLRLNFRPASWLELGASRTVMFGGEGRPKVKFDDFLEIVGGENVGGSAESNQLAAIDARLRLPFLRGAELYGEYGGEDQADLLDVIPFFSKKALLAGLYLPRVEPSRRLDLRLEYADLNFEDHGPVWYRHGLYPYTYEGRILGHHVGGDAKDYFVELRAFLPRKVTLTASLDLQRRGDSLPVREKHEIPSVEAEWEAVPGFILSARYAFDRVENFAFVEGDDRNFHFARAGLSWSW
jgi:hypothetical protein